LTARRDVAEKLHQLAIVNLHAGVRRIAPHALRDRGGFLAHRRCPPRVRHRVRG
jgi:hypothetical protein